MFKKNGLMNNKYLPLTMVPLIMMGLLLVVAGCTNEPSENYVSFDKPTEQTEQPQETCPAIDEGNKTPSLKDSQYPDDIGRGKLVPVIAMRPEEIDAAATEPVSEIKLLIKDRTFNLEDNALRINYDDIDLLKILNMTTVPENAIDHFPDWLRQLDGKQIRVRGFMVPPHRADGIRLFVLARDNEICCFGKSPKIYDLIEVLLKKGTSTKYILGRPFDVVGTFHYDVVYDSGIFIRFYTMTDAEIISK